MDRIEAMRLFQRLAERGNFSAAARDLKIKQSTASKWLAELEAELGVTLIERTTRALHLTEGGKKVLAQSSQLVAAFDALSREMKEQRAEPSGRLRISLPVVFGRLFVVGPIGTFLRRHKQLDVEILFSDRYTNLVDEGFDLAVRVGVPTDTSARGRKLGDSRRWLVASPGYVKAHGRPRAPSELKNHECLIHGDAGSTTMWRFGRAAGATQPVRVHGRIAANNSEAVLQLCRSGLGIALLADWLVAEDLARKRLLPLLRGYDAPPAPIYALTPPGRYPQLAVRMLIDHLAVELAAVL